MAGLRLKKPVGVEPLTDKEIKQIVENFKLSKKRADFCREFLIDYDPQKACTRAGITKKYGYALLQNKKVIDALTAMQGTLEAYDDITPAKLVGQMAIWSKSKIGDYFYDDWKVKRPDELTPAQLSCIESVSRKVTQFGVDIKITLISKKQANENLARPLGLYKKPDPDADEVDEMTAEQLEAFINEHYAD